jgi:hypothetical protein
VVSLGTFRFKTMMVMTTAITPSLKASRRWASRLSSVGGGVTWPLGP